VGKDERSNTVWRSHRDQQQPNARFSGLSVDESGLRLGTILAITLRMTRLLTERDASQWLGLSVRTLQKWRLQGDGPKFLKLGHAVRYDPADLQVYMDSVRRRSTSDPGLREQGERIQVVASVRSRRAAS
jgi:predicted DNA-binding transcriptional regulator AlpA